VASVLVIGVGNEFRRDDAVGLIAARRLCEAAGGSARLLEASGEGTALLDAWQSSDAVILIDAVSSGGRAGAIRRIDAREDAVPTELFRYSTHAVTVADAIELARTLHRLPPRLIVFGIEGADFTAGVGLSPAVERAVSRLVRRGLQEIHLRPS